MNGRVVTSGGPEVAGELEEHGYEGVAERLGVLELTADRVVESDPFADPLGF
jgi:hypothetical protein